MKDNIGEESTIDPNITPLEPKEQDKKSLISGISGVDDQPSAAN